MASYYMNEAGFELPERTFVDKTIHGLEATPAEGGTLAVFVHRRPIKRESAGGSDIEQEGPLRELVDENIALNLKRLSAFAVVEDTAASVGGLPGFVLRTRWRQNKLTFCQLQAHVIFEGVHMIFAVGAPLTEEPACDETFDSILQTLTWRSP